jgi:hypothetical protein
MSQKLGRRARRKLNPQPRAPLASGYDIRLAVVCGFGFSLLLLIPCALGVFSGLLDFALVFAMVWGFATINLLTHDNPRFAQSGNVIRTFAGGLAAAGVTVVFGGTAGDVGLAFVIGGACGFVSGHTALFMN